MHCFDGEIQWMDVTGENAMSVRCERQTENNECHIFPLKSPNEKFQFATSYTRKFNYRFQFGKISTANYIHIQILENIVGDVLHLIGINKG